MLQIRKLWSQYRQATKDFRVESPIDEISEIMEQLNIIVPPSVHENLYAYLLTIPGSAPPIAGRCRIVLYEIEHENMYQITGICEQWKSGWVHCFQLIDDVQNVDEAFYNMEEMMKIFISGKKSSEEPTFFAPRPKKAKQKSPNNKSGMPIKNYPEGDKPSPKTEVSNLENSDKDDDDFDWI